MGMIVLGGIEQRVVLNSIRQLESVYLGARVRMADGTLVSTERDGKRRVTFDVVWVNQGEENAVRTACPRGEAGLVDFGDGVDVQALVDIGDGVWVQRQSVAGGFEYNTKGLYKRVTVRIEEA